MPRTQGDSFMHGSDIQYFAHSRIVTEYGITMLEGKTSTLLRRRLRS